MHAITACQRVRQELMPRRERGRISYTAAITRVIYIDGPVHAYPDRHRRDLEVTERLEDPSFTVIRFGHQDDWAAILARYPSIFGAGRQA